MVGLAQKKVCNTDYSELNGIFKSGVILKRVIDVLESGAVRKGHVPVVVGVARAWELCLDEDTVDEMLYILLETGRRIMSGRTSRIDTAATCIMAALRGNGCNLSGADAVKVLELFGISFKCGGMVLNAIKNSYSTPQMRRMIDKIIWEYQQMSRYRASYGEGTDAEVEYAMRLFGIA